MNAILNVDAVQSSLRDIRRVSGYEYSFLCPASGRLVVGMSGHNIRQLAACHIRSLRRGTLHDYTSPVSPDELRLISREIQRQVRGL